MEPEVIITDPAVQPEGSVQVKFDEAQQVKINALMKQEREKAERRVREQAEIEKGELLNKLQELEAKNAPKTHNKQGDDDPEALKGKVAELAALVEAQKNETKRWTEEARKKADEAAQAKSDVQNVQKKIAMNSAAQSAKFRNLDHAVLLTQDAVKWDSEHNSWVVLGEHGQPRMNASMEPLSLEEFYQDFAAKHKYMVAGDIASGVGSTPNSGQVLDGLGTIKLENVFGSKSNSALAMQLKKQQPAVYSKMKIQAQAQGLIA